MISVIRKAAQTARDVLVEAKNKTPGDSYIADIHYIKAWDAFLDVIAPADEPRTLPPYAKPPIFKARISKTCLWTQGFYCQIKNRHYIINAKAELQNYVQHEGHGYLYGVAEHEGHGYLYGVAEILPETLEPVE